MRLTITRSPGDFGADLFALTCIGFSYDHDAMQVFNLFKDGPLSAFHHEREVLGILKQSPAEASGIQVLPRLIMTSANLDTAAAMSIVTKPVASPITEGS